MRIFFFFELVKMKNSALQYSDYLNEMKYASLNKNVPNPYGLPSDPLFEEEENTASISKTDTHPDFYKIVQKVFSCPSKTLKESINEITKENAKAEFNDGLNNNSGYEDEIKLPPITSSKNENNTSYKRKIRFVKTFPFNQTSISVVTISSNSPFKIISRCPNILVKKV